MAAPITGNLALPYYETVPGGLHPGMAVYVKGRVPKVSNRFRVDFAFAKHEGADLAFHFNPRFDLNELVIDTFESGRWGKAERHKNPFRKGKPFELIFIVTEAGYQALPYYETVPGGLHPGMAVYVKGRVPKVSNRFRVDFAFAKHEGADLAFHFNPRFDLNELVIDTFESGRWGKAERHKNPFRKGKPFELIFIVTEAGYQILVNRDLMYVFRHRIPPQSVHFIEVSGDLELHSLNMMAAPVIENVALPYYETVPGGLHPGMAVYVKGRVPKVSNRFKVDFAVAKHEGADLAFHFNPRFDLNELVIDTFESGKWKKQEKYQNPFRKGEHFKVIFIVTEAGYQILVNRDLMYVFRHRIPPQSVHFIEVSGDLELHSLNMMAAPVTENVPVPYTGDSWCLTIEAKIYLPNGKQRCFFTIDFVAGPDIPLRINPDLYEKTVVCNSFLKGSWGSEERDLPFNPFQYEQYFELLIHCDQYRFIVYANDEYFFSYAYRYIHFPQIKILEIIGDRMPYNRAVPWGLDMDSWVMLEGVILKQSKGFHVEFAYGQFNGANIPLKFKLYFERTPESSNSPVLTLNSFVNQQWGKEIQAKTHFQQGQKFKLSFIVTSKSYKIMENNILLSEFDHRLSPKAIRFLGMDGDIKLEKVVFSWERNSETSNPRFDEG
ncbi:hypothetical protein E2320_000808 [Naja naja]|nr:hypothetical protein E2320_000808 [Naja naja]